MDKTAGLKRDAIFSDGTKHYVFPQEPESGEKVRIRCRTAKKDAESVALIFRETKTRAELELPMSKVESDDYFDYYEASFVMGEKSISYRFCIQKSTEVVYLNQQGVIEAPESYYDFRLIPGYHTPEWAKGAVFYQIFVDRFANGDISNNVEDEEYVYIGEPVKRVNDWYRLPEVMDVREFYGGDLKGVWNKLDYLQELGVEVLYLNPIFVSPSNHKYDTQDYDYIDPHLTILKEDGGEVLSAGDKDNSHATKYKKRVTDKRNLEASNDFFAEFVREVHSRGMRIILDGVFNHCGSFNKWLDREMIYESEKEYESGAYVSEDSPYRTFFRFFEEAWPQNEHYDGWWGHNTLPKLNYEESPKLVEYILNIAKKWVSPPYNIDGWRLDVAADLGQTEEYNHKFWKRFREEVKKVNEDAIILAEHYGDATPWVSGGEWDTVMNYDAFMEPITWFLTGMEKHSDVFRPDLFGNVDAFWQAMKKYAVRFTCQSMQVAMNELSNHDHSRFLTRTNHTVGRVTFSTSEAAEQGTHMELMMAAVIFQMTWIGAPTVYYGDEAGLCGWTDPDNRRTYPWGRENQELIFCHREMIRIHKDYEAFRTGSTICLQNQKGLLSYGRFDEKDKIAVAIYIGDEAKEIELPVWKMGVSEGTVMMRLAESDESGFTIATHSIRTKDGNIKVHMNPNSAVVYKNLRF